MNKYDTFLNNLMLTKNKLSDVSGDERRELCKLHTEIYGFFICNDMFTQKLLINTFSLPDGLPETDYIEYFKQQIFSAVDNDLIRSFKTDSEFKRMSENNENPF